LITNLQDAEPTRFTSQETDLQSTPGQADDLVNMHARFYHPAIARFLSADLLRGDPHSPQSFNLFAYVRGNPKSFWDPLGLTVLRYSFPIYTGFSLAPSFWVTWFADSTTVTGTAPSDAGQFLLWMAFDLPPAPWQGGGGGSIMERLARQPRAPNAGDVLKTINSFECDATWGHVFQNVITTNSVGPRGFAGLNLYGPRNIAVNIAGRALGGSVPEAFGLPTAMEFVGGGFRGLVLDGVGFTGAGVGALTVEGLVAETAFTLPAFEAGVLAGSFMDEFATARCHYTN